MTTSGWPTDRAIPSVRFATSPSDALQCLLDLKESMRRLAALTPDDKEAWDPITNILSAEHNRKDWETLISNGLAPFFWSAHTAALVTAASHTYPLEQEEAIGFDAITAALKNGHTPPPPSYLPKRERGLCVFEEPCLFMEIDGLRLPLTALGWIVGLNLTTREIWLSLRGVIWSGNWAVVVWWSDGGAVETRDLVIDGTFRAERLAFIRWLCTAAMFLDQEIVATARVTPDRATRRRAEKLQIDPTCHVVTLRKTLEADHQTTGLSAVEWSHRWLVRGHWRRQFYPSRHGHAPVWIHPHVKGPDDKPFMEPKPTVFTVVR